MFTIEPGGYVSLRALDLLPDTPRNRPFAAAVRAAVTRYDRIGVRIEDDYVVTPSGLERLSTGAPRDADEIERLMGAGRRPWRSAAATRAAPCAGCSRTDREGSARDMTREA